MTVVSPIVHLSRLLELAEKQETILNDRPSLGVRSLYTVVPVQAQRLFLLPDFI